MDARSKINRIENYNLFGESNELPDVVHCETIQARSVLHNWEFKAHRHQRLHQVLLIDTGGGHGILDGGTIKFGQDSLLNVPAGCVHSFRFEESTRGWVVTLGVELLDEILRADEGLGPILRHAAVVDHDRPLKLVVSQIFSEHAERNFARAHILRALSAQLLGHVARAIENLDYSDATLSDTPLRARFEKSLDENFHLHWSVADYAHQLSVSPTHLSRVLREATGLSASRLIEARIVREARRHLFFTNLNISQIAYLLGYEDPAYFSRVFSKATGMSPKQFRLQAEQAS